ncbi:hypothetical protein EJ04DRAFT_86375 [Polyplosphaeria fusca]|uniref:Ankyrin n=1 Tax=Polyplosphaeria fusca TaxID=682080 RepID=A0A9P4QK73_9PLEO|nr:hypothetical protein EJ04DRAFT_86375 [Polyplosphaeria fusca]
MDPIFPNFMRNIVEDLLVVEDQLSDRDKETTRADYTQTLCIVAVSRCARLAYSVFIRDIDHPIRPTKAAIFAPEVHVNRVAAAAAVGNLEALRASVAHDTTLLWQRSLIFGHPLAAASAAGDLLMVQIFCKYFKRNARFEGIVEQKDAFEEAIEAAIAGRHRHITSFLLPLHKNTWPDVSESAFKGWLLAAVGACDIDLVYKVLGHGHYAKPATIGRAFNQAVERGYINIALLFCEKGFLPVSISYDRYSCPVGTAVRHQNLTLLKGLLDIGGDPNGPINTPLGIGHHLIPLVVAVRNWWVEGIEVLLRAGADPTLVPARNWNIALNTRLTKKNLDPALARDVRMALKRSAWKSTALSQNALSHIPDLFPSTGSRQS